MAKMANFKPEISICIPTFNRASHLNFMLENLCKQSLSCDLEYEILISDNASSDDTQKIISNWGRKLPIRSFRQEKNIGGVANTFFLFEQASAEFTVYVADDDYVDMIQLASCLRDAQSMPNVGVVYTPWKIGTLDSPNNNQFYNHHNDFLIRKGNFPDLLSIILKFHIFPEIFIFRSKLFLELLPITKENIVFDYFSIISECLNSFDIFFTTKVFYTSVTQHPAGTRIQTGNEQAKFLWDSYRGGLEVLLGHSIKLVSSNAVQNFRENINSFVAIRLSVAIRLRVFDNSDAIETYLLACRLRGLGFENLLPIPFKQICTRAAFEYVAQRTLGKNLQAIVLLGDFDEKICKFLIDKYNFADVKILSELTENIKNSIIFFRSNKTNNTWTNNMIDSNGNYYFSEMFLMNVKFK